MSPQVRETKAKLKQMRLHQTKKLLHSKGNYQQNEKGTNWMGQNTFLGLLFIKMSTYMFSVETEKR